LTSVHARAESAVCLRFADSGETGRWNGDDVSDCRAYIETPPWVRGWETLQFVHKIRRRHTAEATVDK